MYFCGSFDRAIRCDGKGCLREVEIRDHRYEMLRAASQDGWFFRKDYTEAFCLEHLSVPLIAWRDRNNPGWRGRLRRGLSEKLPSVESAKRVASSSSVRYNGRGSEPTDATDLPRGGRDEQ